MEKIYFAMAIAVAFILICAFIFFYNKLCIKVGVVNAKTEGESNFSILTVKIAKDKLGLFLLNNTKEWALAKSQDYLHLAAELESMNKIKDSRFINYSYAYSLIAKAKDNKESLSDAEVIFVVTMLNLQYKI